MNNLSQPNSQIPIRICKGKGPIIHSNFQTNPSGTKNPENKISIERTRQLIENKNSATLGTPEILGFRGFFSGFRRLLDTRTPAASAITYLLGSVNR